MKKLYSKTLGVLCLSLFATKMMAQTTYYVKTGGTGAAATATNWAAASKDLQDVINTAQSGDRIFVAKGTYLPNRPANTLNVINATSKDNAFVLKDGVNIYGGFAGTEANENQRTPGNETILSGDLNGDDVEENSSNTNTYMIQNKGDNVYHIVLAVGLVSPTIFDGFTLTKGDAAATTASTLTVNAREIDRRFGGGMYILESGANFKVANVIAKVHRANGDGGGGAATGAGFYINNSNLLIDNCQISKCFNTNATPKTGGYNYGSAMSMVVSASPSITNTVFSESFGAYGGAVSINSGTATFTNCTFKLNRSNNGRGGAVDVRVGSPIFINCLFTENSVGTADGGGAVANYSGRPSFINCVFYNNSTVGNGAAYATSNGSHYGAVFINNTFYGNKNTRGGSALNYTAGLQTLAVSSGNVYNDKKTHLYNNLFFGNTFTAATSDTSTPDLYVANTTTSLGDVYHNIFQQTLYVPGGQNNQTNVDPLFISVALGHLGFLAPQQFSPAKDAGNNSYNGSATDFNGRARKNGTIDIGAIEYHSVLPVSFVSFTSKATTKGAQLQWKVASENHNRGYLISRSVDGKNYQLLTKVAGVGSSDTPLSYSYTDQTVSEGTYYYQLEQEDADGTVNYLATQVVKMELSNHIVKVYPNPSRGNVSVALTSGAYTQYRVLDMQGIVVMGGNIGVTDKQVEIGLSSLATGTYVIKLTGAGGHRSERVVKL